MKGQLGQRDSTVFKVGDRVKVRAGKGHGMAGMGKIGTIVEIGSPALGIKFDGTSEIHRWYTDEEIQRAGSDK